MDAMHSVMTDIQDVDTMILSPTNDDILKINDEVIRTLPGDEVQYLIEDTARCETDEEASTYPMELFDSLTSAGMPTHKLIQKRGIIIMLLQN